jgi:uncharacterized protein YjdB
MIFTKSKKVLSAFLSLAMIGTMVASVPFSASAATTTPVGVTYRAHVQTIGWQSYVNDGAEAGTDGQAKRVEALNINLTGTLPAGASITYQAHVQSIGWQKPVTNGAEAGTDGQAKRVEALKITLAGMPGYSVEYRVHQQTYGWSNWVTTANGTAITTAVAAGVTGKSKRLEAVEVKIVNNNFAVASVSTLNAKTAVITFTQPVLKSTVVTGSDLLAAGIKFAAIGSAGAITSASAGAVLSADKKTLTITPAGAQYFKGSYAVTVDNTVTNTDTSATAIIPYSNVVDLTDSVRPTASVSYPSNGVARVTFSEPMDVTNAAAIENAMTITAPSGESALVPTNRVTLAADKTYFDIALTNFTADKAYTVTLVGLSDYAGNLITPNPDTFSVISSTVDNVKPTVTSVEALDVNKVKITFSEKLSALGTVNGEAIVVGTNATVDSTGLIYTVTTTSADPALSGVAVVTLAGFQDLSANVGAPYTKTLNFVADTTDPIYVSSQLETVGADQYLYITYNEDVQLGAPTDALTGTYVDSNSITKTMTPITTAGNAELVLATDATTTNTIRVKVTGLTAGTYTVATDAALVEDLASNPAASKTITFDFSTYNDPTVPTATITSVQAAEDTVVVTYSMDVTAATALNPANYTVEGQQVFKGAIFDGNAHTVKLTLNPNVITVTGNRMLTVKNVATAAGKVMADYSVSEPFIENVKPYLASAQLASATTITATFSEAVTGSANAFEVYVDGTKIATGVTATAAVAQTTVTITIPTVTDLTKTYTVKFIGTNFQDGAATPNSAVLSTIVTVAK